MGLLTQPTLLVEFYLKQYPASLGTRTIHLTRSRRPISIANHFFEPRIRSISPIVRAATDADGNYPVGSCTITIDDRDGELFALLEAGTTTEYWINREVGIWVLSKELLAVTTLVSQNPPMHRGWISDYQQDGRDIIVTVSDVLGSQMSGFNLDKKVLHVPVKGLTDRARDENKERYLPAIMGEWSGLGSPDVDGHPVPQCVVPAIEIEEIDTTDLTAAPVHTFASPPVITGSGIVGATGQTSLDYAVSLITALGETGLSNIVTLVGASSRNLSNYNWVEGTYDNGGSSPYNKVRVWVRATGTDKWYWLDEAGYTLPGPGTWGYANGAAPVTGASGTGVTRDEPDSWKDLEVSAAGAETNMNLWSIMGLCLGYAYNIDDIEGSDTADGTEPKRALIQAAEHGVTTITSDDPQWPFPNPWIERNGVIFTGFLQRGHKLQHHRDGIVTMAANICGPKIGGLVVNQMFRQFQMFLNEYGLKNKGTGWRNQVYGTLETYENGDPILQTSSFEAAQDLSKIFMNDSVGYIGHLWIQDPEETWRDVIKKMCDSSGGHFAPLRAGQIKTFMINTIAAVTSGRHFKERVEILRHENAKLAHDLVVNKFNWRYFWDLDAQRWRGDGLETPNEDSIAAHVPDGVVGTTDRRGLKEQSRDVAYTNDLATATDVIYRELIRRQRRPRYPIEVVPLLGVDHDIGDLAQLTTTHGDNATQTIILQHELALDAVPEEVTLTFEDLNNITGAVGANAAVGDATAIPDTSNMVGDNDAVPPTSHQVG